MSNMSVRSFDITVPQFFAVSGIEEVDLICFIDTNTVELGDPATCTVVADYLSPGFLLHDCFSRIKAAFCARKPEATVFETFVSVLPAPGCHISLYDLVLLAPGLIVAYNQYFVAHFVPEWERWCLDAVAESCELFREVSPGHGRVILLELCRYGKGIDKLCLIKEDYVETFAPGHPSMLFPHEDIDCPGMLLNLWLTVGDDQLHATVAVVQHVLNFIKVAEEWVWMVAYCGDEEDEEFDSPCPLRDAPIPLDNRLWFFDVDW